MWTQLHENALNPELFRLYQTLTSSIEIFCQARYRKNNENGIFIGFIRTQARSPESKNAGKKRL